MRVFTGVDTSLQGWRGALDISVPGAARHWEVGVPMMHSHLTDID